MKLNIQDLAVEVTRRCNMACPHCMRGDAKNLDLNLDRFAEFIANVDSIGSLTFTGGEPTLNTDAIRFILHMCRAWKIPVYSFYLVTSGKKVTSDFMQLMMDTLFGTCS